MSRSWRAVAQAGEGGEDAEVEEFEIREKV
jgi:hypothetical protein